jgi:hypothetical protein
MKKVSSCNFCCGKKFETVIEKIADLQFGLPGEFKILKCHTCDLLFTSPQPSKSEISRYYPGEYSTHVRNPDREPSGFRVVIQKSIFLLFADHVTRDRFIARHLMTWHRMRENVETFNTHYFPA